MPRSKNRARAIRTRRSTVAQVAEALLPFVCVFLLGLYASVTGARAATEITAPAPPEAATPSCLEDALGKRYCSPEPSGSAVLDTLGRVLCAPGTCVGVRDGWLCAATNGGKAYLDRAGEPQCDGGCAPPEATYCVEQ